MGTSGVCPLNYAETIMFWPSGGKKTMALDEAPSVEIEDVSATSAAPAADAVPEAAPVAAAPETDTSTPDTSVADVGQNAASPAEQSESREEGGNKDINLEQIKADSKPDINHGLVGAAQQAAEHHEQQREAKEEKEKEFEDALDNARDQSKDAQRREREQEEQRKAWEAKTHQMGGVEMSGADLEKLLNFMKSPAAVAKVEAAMKAKGASQKQIEKAQKEWKEYNDLKDKEKSGEQLTPQELKRLQEINKSPEFQQYSQTATEVAHKVGIDLPTQKTKEATNLSSKIDFINDVSSRQEARALQQTDLTTLNKKESGFEELSGKSIAKSHFSGAPDLTNSFATSSALPIAQGKTPVVANDLSGDTPAAAVVTQAKAKPAALDTSFG